MLRATINPTAVTLAVSATKIGKFTDISRPLNKLIFSHIDNAHPGKLVPFYDHKMCTAQQLAWAGSIITLALERRGTSSEAPELGS